MLIIPLVILGVFFWLGNKDRADFFSREFQILSKLIRRDRVVRSQFSYIKKIDEGIELLESSSPLKFRADRFGNLFEKQVAFAVFNTETGEVFEKRGWISESQAQNYRSTGIMNISMDSDGPDVSIKPNWFNSFNSDYQIIDHPEMAVVANKYLFVSSGLPKNKRSGTAYTDIVYVPYSGGLHVKEVVDEGIRYINQKTLTAYKDLEALNVRSRTDSQSLVTELVSPNLIKNILLVEHVDPNSFNNAGNERRRELLDRVLVIIGSNRERAYGFTGSPAGASGIAQFIRPTYEYMASLYPSAKLIRDYQLGMMDHHNSIKAQVLFFDRHIENLEESIRRQDLVKAIGINDEMLAASYNGGPARVIQSVNQYGLAWINLQFGTLFSSKIFRQETIDYVKKFQFVRGERVFD